MEKETQTIERLNSCEISVNAKAQWSVKIKVYGITINEAISKATEKAEEQETKIKIKNSL